MAFTSPFAFASVSASSSLPSPQVVMAATKNSTTALTAAQMEAGKAYLPGTPMPIDDAFPYLSRMSALPESVYAAQAAAVAQGHRMEPSAFYSLAAGAQAGFSLDRAHQEIWKNLNQHPQLMYSFDPMLAAAHPYGAFYGGLDLNNAARRKNATRETTSALKAWLYEHRKNPYPTKGEKIMLAIVTKMTLTQVSTWFANARRRLKKESKVGWKKDKDADDNDSDIDIDDSMKDSADETDEEGRCRIESTSSAENIDSLYGNRIRNHDIKVTSDLSDISDNEIDVKGDEHDNDEKSENSDFRSIQKQNEEKKISECKLPTIPLPGASRDNNSVVEVPKTTCTVSSNNQNSANNFKPKIWSIDDVIKSPNTKSDKSSKRDLTGRHQLPFPVPVLSTTGSYNFHQRAEFKPSSKHALSTPPGEETALNLAVVDNQRLRESLSPTKSSNGSPRKDKD